MVDAGDLKSPVLWTCGFESRRPHQGSPGQELPGEARVSVLGPGMTNRKPTRDPARGRAVKIAALDAVVAKHTPQHVGTAYPENMLKMTAVVEITIHEITGKYYA